MKLSKAFTFSAAHNIVNYKGKCENLHGHNYKLIVTIEGPVDKESGMVMDFYEVKIVVKAKVLDKLDHSYINDTIPLSTAENIALWIWEQLKGDLPLYEVTVYETEGSFVSYRGE